LVTCADDRTLRVWDRTSGQVHTCCVWAAVRLYPGQVL
jgi:WD40 repeat protein